MKRGTFRKKTYEEQLKAKKQRARIAQVEKRCKSV